MGAEARSHHGHAAISEVEDRRDGLVALREAVVPRPTGREGAGLHRLDAEQVAGRVDAVDALVEHRSSAPPRRSQPDVARRDVLREGRREVDRSSDGPAAYQLHRPHVGWLEVEAIRDHELHAGVLARGDHLSAVFLRGRHGLLAQHVLAVLRREQRVVCVQVVGYGDVDRVDFVRAEEVTALSIVDGRHVVAAAQEVALFGVARDDRGQGGVLGVLEGGQDRHLSDVTRADDREAKGTFVAHPQPGLRDSCQWHPASPLARAPRNAVVRSANLPQVGAWRRYGH